MTNFEQYNIVPSLTPVRVVSTANVAGTYSNGPTNNGVGATLTVAASSLTVDSVVLAVGDRVLLQAQSSAFQNGIYVVNSIGATVVLQRSADLQSQEQLHTGFYVSVGAGTVNAGAMYAIIEPLPAALGINTLSFNAMITSGLGTASTKAATDNAQPDVVSINGATVVTNLAAFSDTAGTIIDSGFNLQIASVAITAAQFNGMYAAPKLLIAAPGANKLIVVHKMDLVMTFVSAAYAAGGIVAAQYDSTVHGAGVLATNSEAAADFFAAASATFSFISNSGSTAGVMPFTTSVNKGLYLSNATGAFTTGDSTWVAKIFYSIIPTV